ncbi:MAG: hypothetical protein ACRC9P_04795 [Bacteroides sp.]
MGTNLNLILILLLLVGCKSSKQLTASRVVDEKKDVIQTSNLELTKIDKLFSDLVINTDRKLDFIVFDTNKPITEGKPPVLIEGSLVDSSVITDKSQQDELITDNSEVVIENKGTVNIRDELQSKEKNSKSWIDQLTRFGFIIMLLLGLGIYIKKR